MSAILDDKADTSLILFANDDDDDDDDDDEDDDDGDLFPPATEAVVVVAAALLISSGESLVVGMNLLSRYIISFLSVDKARFDIDKSNTP